MALLLLIKKFSIDPLIFLFLDVLEIAKKTRTCDKKELVMNWPFNILVLFCFPDEWKWIPALVKTRDFALVEVVELFWIDRILVVCSLVDVKCCYWQLNYRMLHDLV